MSPTSASLYELKFAEPSMRESFRRRMERTVTEDIVDDAYYFIENLEPLLQDESVFPPNQEELLEFYTRLVVAAKFVILPQLSDDEVVTLLEEHYVDHFDLKPWLYDLRQKIHGKLLTVYLPNRDPFKSRLRQALEQNQQLLTQDFLTIQEAQEKPTVANWLRDFRVFAADRKIDALLINEYLTRSGNVQKLSSADQGKIRGLITLYQKLKISSLTFEGIEDTVIYTDDRGDTYSFSEGQIEKFQPLNTPIIRDAQGNLTVEGKIETPVPPVQETPPLESAPPVKGPERIVPLIQNQNPYQRLRQAYSDYTRSQGAVRDLEEKVLNETGQNQQRLKEDIIRSLEARDVNRVLAGLFLLAKGGVLSELFRGDAYFIDLLEPYLAKNFSSGVAKSFKNAPNAPAFLNALIHVLLRAKLQLDDNSSAIVALQLGEFAFFTGLFQTYGMSFGNPKSGRFEWHQLDTSRPDRLEVSKWQMVSARMKLSEMDRETVWKIIQPSALVTEDRRGRPRQLHEFGRDILAHLTSADIAACEKRASTDFRHSIGDEDALRQIEQYASNIEAGTVPDVAREQSKIIREFVDLLRV